MQDGAVAMRPHRAELEQVHSAVAKVLRNLHEQVLDKVAALNSNLALNAFAIPPPHPAEAKRSFDEYSNGLFKLLNAGNTQGEKIRDKARHKTNEVLQQFATQFASQVNQAMEIERKNWKEEARAREREAAERLKQSRAALSNEGRSASREGESAGGHEQDLAKRAAKIKELQALLLQQEVQQREDEETIAILRAKGRDLQNSAAKLEVAERALGEAKAKLLEQDGLLESYRGQIKDGERSVQKLKGEFVDDELKLMRKQLAAAQREAQEQSDARAAMQDQLQDALDALSDGAAGAHGSGTANERAELRRKVAQLEVRLAETTAAAAAAAAAFVPIPSPPPARRGLGEMNAKELREELTVFIERLVDAKAGAVDVGVEGVSAELAALARQLRHLLPADGGDDELADGIRISPSTALLGVRAASPTIDELEQQVKQVKQQLAISETEVKSLTKQMAFVAEGRRVAEQEAKKMRDELGQLRKDKKSADVALNQLASAARTEERLEARQEAKAAKVEKGEMAELRRLNEKYKRAEATALAKLQSAKDFATKYQEEKSSLAAANKQLTKQLKETLAQHQHELVQLSRAAKAESSAVAQSEQERLKSREGAAQAMESQALMWEQALRDEHERGQAALRTLEQDNAALQERVAQLQARAAAAEGGLAQIGSQLSKKDGEIQQKSGQIQRLVTACSVLEQKVRAMSGGGAGANNSGDSTGESSTVASSSLLTVDNLSAAGSGKRCAMCGGHALFDRSLEAATSSGFLPSSTTSSKVMALTGLREMTRFGATAKWAPAPEPAKPGHYEDGTQAASRNMAIADVSNSLLLDDANDLDTIRTEREPEEPPQAAPDPEPEWLRGDDGWYFGDIEADGETMCWMASRRLESPERARIAQQLAGGNPEHPRLQLTNNGLPPRAQSVPAGVGLPRLAAAQREKEDKNATRSSVQGVSWAEGTARNEASIRVSKSVSSLELAVPQSPPELKIGGKSKAISLAASAASLQHAQAARLPRLGGHLHVPPAALQQAQEQARKGKVY